MAKTRDTEVDAYIFIKENLKTIGWDVRNPARNPTGEVYTQNECLSHPEIKKCLGNKKPENIVKLTDTLFWIIEAKRSHKELKKALLEAKEDYAKLINKSTIIKAVFISGVAGNNKDGFLIKSRYLKDGMFVPISLLQIKLSAKWS